MDASGSSWLPPGGFRSGSFKHHLWQGKGAQRILPHLQKPCDSKAMHQKLCCHQRRVHLLQIDLPSYRPVRMVMQQRYQSFRVHASPALTFICLAGMVCIPRRLYFEPVNACRRHQRHCTALHTALHQHPCASLHHQDEESYPHHMNPLISGPISIKEMPPSSAEIRRYEQGDAYLDAYLDACPISSSHCGASAIGSLERPSSDHKSSTDTARANVVVWSLDSSPSSPGCCA